MLALDRDAQPTSRRRELANRLRSLTGTSSLVHGRDVLSASLRSTSMRTPVCDNRDAMRGGGVF